LSTPAALRLGLLRHREIPFDKLRKRELITHCELPQNLVSVSGEPDSSVLAQISPARPDYRLQLFPLSCVEKTVTPALQGLRGRFFVRELVPRREPRPALWPRIVSEPFTNPPVHHANISGCDSVTHLGMDGLSKGDIRKHITLSMLGSGTAISIHRLKSPL
jgi:hypothetical protein